MWLVLAATAHLYMSQLFTFTHCLPTIICVTLISIVNVGYYKTIVLYFFIVLVSAFYVLFL